MTPAETLTAAAEKLRVLAAEATRGPWWAERPAARWGEDPDHEVAASAGTLATFHERGSGLNASYTAAMHPGVGTALADWLDAELRMWAGDEGHDDCTTRTCTIVAALAVARQLLGGDQ
ncbi:hypothetical protein [Streptomyces sp. NRRL F-5630]|uniref:hypothetical protein n=1 Tax=Streptomyces sp. NRRL F-5630 TaxID=1463864 RepID=UPI003EB933A6